MPSNTPIPTDSTAHPDRLGLATRFFAELAALPIVATLFLAVFVSLPDTPPVPIDIGTVVVFSILVAIVRGLYLLLGLAARRAPAIVREVFA